MGHLICTSLTGVSIVRYCHIGILRQIDLFLSQNACDGVPGVMSNKVRGQGRHATKEATSEGKVYAWRQPEKSSKSMTTVSITCNSLLWLASKLDILVLLYVAQAPGGKCTSNVCLPPRVIAFRFPCFEWLILRNPFARFSSRSR